MGEKTIAKTDTHRLIDDSPFIIPSRIESSIRSTLLLLLLLLLPIYVFKKKT